MHTTVYEKVQNSARVDCRKTCKCHSLMSLIWCCSCHYWVNKLPNYLLQQFPHYFILFWTLGLTIYLKIRQSSSAWLPTSNTVRGLRYLVQWSVTQDNVRLTVTSPVLHLVIYNFCNELWCRCASTNLVPKWQI